MLFGPVDPEIPSEDCQVNGVPFTVPDRECLLAAWLARCRSPARCTAVQAPALVGATLLCPAPVLPLGRALTGRLWPPCCPAASPLLAPLGSIVEWQLGFVAFHPHHLHTLPVQIQALPALVPGEGATADQSMGGAAGAGSIGGRRRLRQNAQEDALTDLVGSLRGGVGRLSMAQVGLPALQGRGRAAGRAPRLRACPKYTKARWLASLRPACAAALGVC